MGIGDMHLTNREVRGGKEAVFDEEIAVAGVVPEDLQNDDFPLPEI